MGRSTKAGAAAHREEIIRATSTLVRERGSAQLSVPTIMSAVGLTHGGFYKHFESKDELLGLAATDAFSDVLSLLDALTEVEDDERDTAASLATAYLTKEHRDYAVPSCANAALLSEATRSPADGPVRQSYIAGVHQTVDKLAAALSPGDPGSAAAREKAVSTLAVLVGALTLARATAGDPISDTFLTVPPTRMPH